MEQVKNNMVELLPSLFAIEVPDEVCGIGIQGDKLWALPSPERYFRQKYADLPPGSYSILFTTKDCTEIQAYDVVSKIEGSSARFINYETTDNIGFFNCVNSLASLLRSRGLSLDKNYLLIRKTA